MNEEHSSPSTSPKMAGPACYEIRASGNLDPSWQEWFAPLVLSNDLSGSGPVLVLTGTLPDQAALNGALQKLYTLGLPVLSVRLV